MRVLVISRPKHAIPPEQMPGLVDAFAAWRERYRAKMEVFEFFAGAGGGFGILNADSEIELNQIMLEYPFSFASELEIRAIVNGDTALGQLQAAMQQMMAHA